MPCVQTEGMSSTTGWQLRSKMVMFTDVGVMKSRIVACLVTSCLREHCKVCPLEHHGVFELDVVSLTLFNKTIGRARRPTSLDRDKEFLIAATADWPPLWCETADVEKTAALRSSLERKKTPWMVPLLRDGVSPKSRQARSYPQSPGSPPKHQSAEVFTGASCWHKTAGDQLFRQVSTTGTRQTAPHR